MAIEKSQEDLENFVVKGLSKIHPSRFSSDKEREVFKIRYRGYNFKVYRDYVHGDLFTPDAYVHKLQASDGRTRMEFDDCFSELYNRIKSYYDEIEEKRKARRCEAEYTFLKGIAKALKTKTQKKR